MFESLVIACATCSLNNQNDSTNAASWSIFFLLAIILPVLGGVIFFMVRMARRSSETLDPELRDELPVAAPSAR